MPVASTLAIAAATSLIKKAVDEVYAKAKDEATKRIGKSRSDLRDLTIARAVSSVTKVKTLWNVDKEVSLYDFYYPSQIQFQEAPRRIFKSLSDFGKTQSFVIQGTAGQGKSIFLRYLCGQELSESTSSGRIPLFVELRRLRKDFGIRDSVCDALKKYKLPATDGAWEFFAESGKFVLLLDAFDEIEPSVCSQALSDLEDLIDRHPGTLQVIVTSRPDADIQKSTRFRVARLAALQSEDHSPFLRKICSDKQQAESLLSVVERSTSDIRALLTTPLMLTLLVILYKSLQTVPDTVPKFYEELFDVLFYRHDQSKPGFRRKRYTDLDDGKVKMLFSAFCFFVRLENFGVLSAAQMEECVRKACKASNEYVDPTKFRDELVKTVCLMQQDGFEISFIHKSVVQYYAAAFVARSADQFGRNFYLLASREREKWNLELRFLSSIDAYRFSKHYELPLLEHVASSLGYSFGEPDRRAEERLNEILFKGIELVSFPLEEARSDARHRLAGWMHPSSSEDLVVSELAQPWMQELWREGELVVTPKPHTNPLQRRPSVETPRPRTQPAASFKSEILERCPDIARVALQSLQNRYDAACAVVRTEEEKAIMLGAFLE
jgi:NACHT domain